MAPSLKTVFFDAGYTLFYIYPSALEYFCTKALELGVELPVEQVKHTLRKCYKAAYLDVTLPNNHGSSPELDWTFWSYVYRMLFRELGLDDPGEPLLRALYNIFGSSDPYRVFPDVVETLEVLKARGYRLGVISNFAPSLPDILDTLGLSGYFEFIAVSTLVGHEKPHARIFEEALAQMGIRPEEAMHIGDSFLADVLGSHAMGIKPVFLDRDHKFLLGARTDENSGDEAAFQLPEGCLHIGSLADLPSCL